jgi:acetoin utilization deacetylase AcuC-like enzyme
MDVLLFTDSAFALHETGAGHPERPARLGALIAGVQDSQESVDVRQPAPASRAALELVHDAHYIDLIQRICAAGGGELDPDTRVVEASWPAALLAAGSGISAIDALRAGDGDLAVCAVRPPGHHATRDRAMGFCVFNNVAVAAAALVASGQRVAIIDWDVHHGNGTQEMFFESPDVLYFSIHEWGPDPDLPSLSFYPGTGWLDEVGAAAGRGTTINVPVPAATAGDVFRRAFSDLVVPAIEHFAADWILVSAGFDAHAGDPLAHLGLVADDYMALAGALATHPGRTLVFAEGGYDLDAMSRSMTASVAGFGGEDPEPTVAKSPDTAWRLLEQARQMAVESGGL